MTSQHLFRLGLLTASLALACSGAAANRPLTTETADVVDDGDHQLEVYAAHDSAGGQPSVNAWTAQLSRGIGVRTQLSLAVSRDSSDGVSGNGLLLGGKTWLIEVGETAPGLAVAYGLTGARGGGESWQHDESYLLLAGTLPTGRALLHANLGTSHSALAHQSRTLWALGMEYMTENKLTLVAETFGDDRGKPTLSFGLLWQLADTFSLNTSYGATYESPRVKQWTLGFQLDF